MLRLTNDFSVNLKRSREITLLVMLALVSWSARAQSDAQSGALFEKNTVSGYETVRCLQPLRSENVGRNDVR